MKLFFSYFIVLSFMISLKICQIRNASVYFPDAVEHKYTVFIAQLHLVRRLCFA